MLIMEYLGLTEMFDFIATGDRYLPKPDADMLQAFCQSCQLKATEVIMVGDSLVDVFMGTCHGKAGIGVLTGNCQSPDFEKFEVAYFRDIHEIPYQELWENTKKKNPEKMTSLFRIFINLIEAIAVSFVEILLLLEFLHQLTVLNFLTQPLRLQ